MLTVVINSNLGNKYASKVGGAAVQAGLPQSSVPLLLQAFEAGAGFDDVPHLNGGILAAATNASQWAYTRAYRLAWWSVFPFVVVAIIAVACLKGVKELMTEKVEATVEKVRMEDLDEEIGRAHV